MDAATDWRISLQPDHRQILVNRIMKTLKNCFLGSGPEGLIKLNKMAEWFEEECYTAATNKSDYLRKISLKILNMEKKFQTTGMPNIIQSISVSSTQNPLGPVSHNMQSQVQRTNRSHYIFEFLVSKNASIDSKAQTRHRAVDWQEETYQKILSMKEKYLPILNDMYQKFSTKCQQLDYLPNVPKSERMERIKLSKSMLERSMQILNVSKNNVVFAEKIASCEKVIISMLSSNRPRKLVSTQQKIQQPSGHPLFMQPQQKQQQQQQQLLPDNQMNHQRQQNAVGQLEEIYKKIESTKDKYLPGLNDMHQKISIKCQQHDSVPSVPNSERIERLKLFKNMLELAMQTFNVSKNNIVPAERIASYEKVILNIFSSNRPQKPVSAQQQVQQPGGHPLSMQPQQQQQQNPDNQMNHQKQPMNMQNSVSSRQSTAMASTQHASIDSKSQTGQNAVDWQEEIYQKIQSMKEKYLPGLNDMHQQISIKCQQHDSIPNVPKSEQIEMLKVFKNSLERTMQMLNVSKNNIVPTQKEKLDAYEKMILCILSKGPWKPVSTQQQILQPGGHPLSMQQEQWRRQQQHHQQQEEQQQ